MEIKSQVWVEWECHLGAPGASKGRRGFWLREDGSGLKLWRSRWDGGTAVLNKGTGSMLSSVAGGEQPTAGTVRCGSMWMGAGNGVSEGKSS